MNKIISKKRKKKYKLPNYIFLKIVIQLYYKKYKMMKILYNEYI